MDDPVEQPREPKAEAGQGSGGDDLRDAIDLAKGAAVNLLGTVAKVSKAAFIVFAARWYGAEALGLYFLAFNTADVVSKLALFGLDRSLIHEAARRGAEPEDLGVLRFHLGVGAVLTVIVSTLLWFVAPAIAGLIFREPGLTLPIRILSIGLPFLVAAQILLAAVRAKRIMRYDAIIRGAIEPLILFILAVAFWPLHWGATGLMVAQSGAFAVTAVLAFAAVLHVYRTTAIRGARLAANEKRAALRFAAPLAVMDILNLLVARMDLFLVGTFLDAAAAGVYGLLVELISVMKRVRQAFEPIFAPIVAQLHYGADRPRLQRSYALVTRWLLGGTLLPMLALTLFSSEVLALFKISASQAFATLIILAVAHTLFGTFSAAENLLVMSGYSGLNTRLATLMVLVNAMVGVVLIPRIGLPGAAVATLIAYTVIVAARVILGYRRLGVQPIGRYLVWPLVAAAATFGIVLPVKLAVGPLTLPVEVLLFGLTIALYSALLIARADEPEERHLLHRLKLNLRARMLARA